MKTHPALWCSVAATALVLSFNPAFAGTTTSYGGPSNAQLEEEIQSLQNELQNAELKERSDVSGLDGLMQKVSGWWNNTSISGRMYYDTSWVRNEVNGAKSGNINGVGFDIKRFYIGVDHKFNDTYSANITTDFQYNSTLGATELFIKKAYLQAKYSDALTLRLGATDMPWIPFVEDVYGYRFVENTLTDRVKVGTSSDWGIHALGKLDGNLINYQFSVVNGSGYKTPSGAGNATHYKSVDVEGRVNLNWQSMILAVGGYYGKLGADIQNNNDHHTGERLDALAAYKTDKIRLGFEYFYARNMTSADIISAGHGEYGQGFGPFASYQFTPKWSVFGRYDYVEPNRIPTVKVKDNYFNVGIDWTPTKIVDFALVYKRDKADDGTISTQNGTIGGSNDGTYDEVGIFSQFRW